MNKKANTFIFILVATVFNIVITIALILGLLVLFMKVIVPAMGLADTVLAAGLVAVFVVAIVLSFLIYRFIINVLSKHVEIDKYFDPLVGKHHRKSAKKADS
jgi:membrane protein implicated in regulation of membrane protease activity